VLGSGWLYRGFVLWVWFRGVFSSNSSVLHQMERCFSVEAKRFSFSAKAEVLELRLEERRKGFYGFIFLGLQGSTWLLASIEEALKVSAKEFVKYYL
jgi:hypothetical protein